MTVLEHTYFPRLVTVSSLVILDKNLDFGSPRSPPFCRLSLDGTFVYSLLMLHKISTCGGVVVTLVAGKFDFALLINEDLLLQMTFASA